MKAFVWITLVSGLMVGCTSIPTPVDEQNRLTHGAVQLEKGITTQNDVLTNFGAPNITTIDAEDHEVWTYQKNATLSRTTESGAVFIIGGFGSSGFQRSSRTMTLIIKFDSNKVVKRLSAMRLQAPYTTKETVVVPRKKQHEDRWLQRRVWTSSFQGQYATERSEVKYCPWNEDVQKRRFERKELDSRSMMKHTLLFTYGHSLAYPRRAGRAPGRFHMAYKPIA